MKLVRRIKSIKVLGGFLDINKTFIEYGDRKNLFYPSDSEPHGVGLDIRLFKSNFDKYFIELEPVNFQETSRYKQIIKEIENELKGIDKELIRLNNRKDYLKSLI